MNPELNLKTENLLRSLWRNYDASLEKSIRRIEKQRSIVDLESHAAKMNVDESRHEEIKRLVSRSAWPKTPRLPCHHIPYPPNRAFFNRRAELQTCRQAFATPSVSTSPVCLALHGIGGVGKTSIALQFAYEQKAQRGLVIWIAAEDEDKLVRSFAEAAGLLGLHEEGADTASDCKVLVTWLSRTGNSLVL